MYCIRKEGNVRWKESNVIWINTFSGRGEGILHVTMPFRLIKVIYKSSFVITSYDLFVYITELIFYQFPKHKNTAEVPIFSF